MGTDDEDFDDDMESENEPDSDEPGALIEERGAEIASLSWDGNGPAHTGSTSVFLCEVEGLAGPIASLDDALDRAGFHSAGTPQPELQCIPEIANSDAVLSAACDLAAEAGGVVPINGAAHIRLGQGALARRNDQDGRRTTVYRAHAEEPGQKADSPHGSDMFAYFSTEVPPGLVVAYLATDYHVFGRYGGFTLRIGHHAPALAALFAETNAASAVFITSANPLSQPTDEQVNAERLDQLYADLAATAGPILTGEGQGQDPSWPAEKSFLALGIPQAQARILGEKYGQNAIVWVGEDAVPQLILLR
jgi:hypothetical protein